MALQVNDTGADGPAHHAPTPPHADAAYPQNVVERTEDGGLISPEITNLLDVRTWALGTLTQIERVRERWSATSQAERGARDAGQDPDEVVDPDSWELLMLDVHYLLIAANQLIDAARRPVRRVRLPRLHRDIVTAIENLRDIVEHYSGHREGFYGDVPHTRHGKALLRLDPAAHPWSMSGSIIPSGARELQIGGVLPVDQLEQQARAIHEVADKALDEIRHEAG